MIYELNLNIFLFYPTYFKILGQIFFLGGFADIGHSAFNILYASENSQYK